MTRIKLHGLCREADVDVANEVLPDYVGFVFCPDSPCYVTPARALELKSGLDEDITVVGVFADAPVRLVAALLNEDLIDIAQLQGHEDAAYIGALRSALRAPDEKAIVQAFMVTGIADVQSAGESAADMVLLDFGANSGTRAEWGLLAGFERPYFLAGGLDDGNVGEALTQTGAAYVEAGAGIGADGALDAAKARAFVQAVRMWDEGHPRLSFLESLHPEFHEDGPGQELPQGSLGGFHPELN